MEEPAGEGTDFSRSTCYYVILKEGQEMEAGCKGQGCVLVSTESSPAGEQQPVQGSHLSSRARKYVDIFYSFPSWKISIR